MMVWDGMNSDSEKTSFETESLEINLKKFRFILLIKF